MVGWRDRRFSDLVGCEHPIVQAPMANAGGVDLCLAAMDGGALGSLPCGMLTPDQVREQAAAVRGLGASAVQLGTAFLLPAADLTRKLAAEALAILDSQA